MFDYYWNHNYNSLDIYIRNRCTPFNINAIYTENSQKYVVI